MESAALKPKISSIASGGQANTPCAGCKFLRRKCQQDCIFKPHFPPDQPQKFVNVHRVFGASNVSKILNELSPFQREDAVNSLYFEAELRLRDPVKGCVGFMSLLQREIHQLQIELLKAHSELAKYQSLVDGMEMEQLQQQNMMMMMTMGGYEDDQQQHNTRGAFS